MRYEWRKIVTQRQLCALLLLVVMCNVTLIAFNPNAIGFVNWQYVADRIVAKKAYNSITISLLYSYNVNEVYFDGIQLFKEEFGHSYVYDSSGTQVVAYTYDAWGNPLTTTGTMADTLGKLNPAPAGMSMIPRRGCTTSRVDTIIPKPDGLSMQTIPYQIPLNLYMDITFLRIALTIPLI